MKAIASAAIAWLLLCGAPLLAQADDASGGDNSESIVVTGSRRIGGSIVLPPKPPVIGIKRQADSAVRNVEIFSDSRDGDLRKREVQAMLLDAIDRAKKEGFSLVTGELEIVEVTRANWQDQFPGLAGKPSATDDEDDDDDYERDDDKPKPVYEDDGSTTTVHLKVKTKLNGSISDAQQAIAKFVKSVPANGRSKMEQKGGLALTIVRPEQYRDDLYRLIAAGAKHAVGFYDAGYGLDITGLDQAIAWKQVSNTEIFVYIPYSFTIRK